MSSRQAVQVGGPPRVQLLPPEVGERARVAATLRLALTVLVLVTIVVGLGIGWAFWRNLQVQSDLLAAQDETTRIVQEQQQYAEADIAASLTEGVTELGRAATAQEILWSGLLYGVIAVLPPGTTVINSVTFDGSAPWEVVASPTDPLLPPQAASFRLDLASPSMAEAAIAIRAIETLPWAGAVNTSSVSNVGFVQTTLTISVNSKALAGRFAEPTPSPTPGETDNPALDAPVTDSPTSTPTEEGGDE